MVLVVQSRVWSKDRCNLLSFISWTRDYFRVIDKTGILLFFHSVLDSVAFSPEFKQTNYLHTNLILYRLGITGLFWVQICTSFDLFGRRLYNLRCVYFHKGDRSVFCAGERKHIQLYVKVDCFFFLIRVSIPAIIHSEVRQAAEIRASTRNDLLLSQSALEWRNTFQWKGKSVGVSLWVSI